jgi:hypothetical protein
MVGLGYVVVVRFRICSKSLRKYDNKIINYFIILIIHMMSIITSLYTK